VASRSLVDAQRWLQQAILAAPRPGPGGKAADVLTSSARLSAQQRLDIYRRGCRLRLLEAMRELHPGLRAWLGPRLFDDFAADYLDACPSRSYSMCELDRRFAEHLAAHRPDRDKPPAEREAWADMIIDLVRYERAFAEVYDGPGTEHLPPPRSDSPCWAPGDMGGDVVPAPCLRVLALCAPVHRYCAAVRAGRPPAPLGPRPVRLALSRRDYVVTATELTPGAHRFLSALLAGSPIRAAADQAELAPGDAARLLSSWAAGGWVRQAPAGTA